MLVDLLSSKHFTTMDVDDMDTCTPAQGSSQAMLLQTRGALLMCLTADCWLCYLYAFQALHIAHDGHGHMQRRDTNRQRQTLVGTMPLSSCLLSMSSAVELDLHLYKAEDRCNMQCRG